MANQNKLAEMMKARNPLSQREAVTPVKLYTNPQEDKPTKQQESIQVDKTTSIQTDKETRPQAVKPVKGETAKGASSQPTKYTTHLTKEVIKAVKRYALETDQKDYEVMQEAITSYLRTKGQKIGG